jgi:hypothetical protein
MSLGVETVTGWVCFKGFTRVTEVNYQWLLPFLEREAKIISLEKKIEETKCIRKKKVFERIARGRKYGISFVASFKSTNKI